MRTGDSPKISSAVLMCHAPIVIPEIGGSRGADCVASTRSMTEIASKLMHSAPDVLVVLSPHTPRLARAFSWVDGDQVSGSFERFGYGELRAEFPNGSYAARMIAEQARHQKVAMEPIPPFSLDHGAMVPLFFMHRAGWSGNTVIIGFPHRPSHVECRRLGRAIADAADLSGDRWALLASGDMSHRLIPDAPAGFHPRAKDFDRHIVDHVKEGDLNGAVLVNEELRDCAAEDVVDSLEIASAAFDFDGAEVEVLSYEGPFGVGYMNAVLRSD